MNMKQVVLCCYPLLYYCRFGLRWCVLGHVHPCIVVEKGVNMIHLLLLPGVITEYTHLVTKSPKHRNTINRKLSADGQ